VNAVEALPPVRTDAVEKEVAKSTGQAIGAIERAGAENPVAASNALLEVGTAAAAQGDTQSAARALTSLKGLQTRAMVRPPTERAAIDSGVMKLERRVAFQAARALRNP
jgi:hypothetical protein